MMNLPLELYGTDEQAALGAWVLLLPEANVAPYETVSVASPTPRTMSRDREGDLILSSPNVHQIMPYHADICASTRLLFFFRYCCAADRSARNRTTLRLCAFTGTQTRPGVQHGEYLQGYR